MRQCSFCHEAIPEDSDFCPFCGKRQEEKVTCPYFGMKNRAGSHFCSRCGMVLHEETDLTVPEAEEQPAQPQETQPENQSEEKSEEKPLIEENL